MNNPVQQQQQQQQPAIGPKTVILYRNSQYGFGFTLRHFIVYPPESPAEQNVSGILNLTQPMDTVFVKDVRINGPAHISGLRPGDRLLSVNGMAVAGTLYANVVRIIQQTPSVLKLIVVPKDCDILQTLFSESAHSPESNQRPCIYANPQEISLNPIVQANANHVPITSPNLASNCGVESTNPLRISTTAKYLNESAAQIAAATAHRHSFNESIYSEPYSGNRFLIGGGRRSDQTNRPNPLCESSSASNISGHNRSGASTNRQYPVNFQSSTITSHSIYRENIYGTIGSIASNRTSTTEQSNSTRSSIYSDKTISNEQTSPKTLNLSTIKWPTDEQTKQTQSINNITCALNASGSPINSVQQSNLNTKIESKVSSPSKAKQSNVAAATALSPTAACSESTDQKPVVGITTAVIRRPKSSNSSSDRPVRRISYLRATANDISVQESTNLDECIEKLPLEKDQCLNDELQQLIQFCKKSSSIEKLSEPELEGKLNIKVSYIESKRATVRQWHRVLAKVRGDKFEIILLRDNESQEPSDTSGIIDLQHFFVMKSNYTKRKYVFKLTNYKPDPKPQSPTNALTMDGSKTEFLIQTDDQASFDSWKNALAKVARSPEEITELKPLQVQIKDKSNGSTSTLEKDASATSSSSSSKTRTWKGLVRQFRRIHGPQTSAPSSPNSNNNSMDIPTVASIGVPLALCPVSAKNKYVPFILARCTEIVETRGLCIIGIYRIPGNTAAISALTELVNKGFDEQTLSDPRWDDVNVVSSLLKLFLRRLPEALIPNDMYKHFIDADDEKGQKRLIGLKVLIDNMSVQFYESLKHLMRHLFLISQNCQTNLMEPKNLAIIFGPSVVRTSNETLETVVKDMKHQCRIVEALVSHYEYFFENAELPTLREQLEQSVEEVPRTQTNLLLDNVAKIESFTDQIEKTRFVFKFVQAARSRKSKKKQTSTLSSITSDTMSMDSSSTSTEYRDSSMTKTENLTDVDVLQSSLSADDSADLFCEDSGSMSLATLIPALEDKFYALHNDADVAQGFGNERNETSSPLSPSILRNHQIISLQPLTIGDETIPYADDSPDQPIMPSIGADKSNENNSMNHGYAFTNNRIKQWNPTTSNIQYTNRLIGNKVYRNHHQDTVDAKSINSIASDDNDDTDESNTSETERDNQTIRINSEVIREMNRILTNLERKATKLNRSLSLNIKYHHNECCCNGGHYTMSNSNHSSCRSIAMNRYSLTKDEKTDKNINLAKKRQIQDNHPKNKRYINRPIKRRHTVGGIHYGYNNKAHSAVVDTTQIR